VRVKPKCIMVKVGEVKNDKERKWGDLTISLRRLGLLLGDFDELSLRESQYQLVMLGSDQLLGNAPILRR